ncbi:MAG: radical SAM protein [Ignavibacteriales bacterium]|nr:radical SAM protein [Ignavibacteriales bacterium]
MILLCNYYVTYRCNAACEFCHFTKLAPKEKNFDAKFEDYAFNLLQISKLGVKFIDLTGGEPLLNKSIVEMTRFARELKIQTSITTNTILYPKYAEKLASIVNLLHFSLDSPNEEEHNKIRNVDCFRYVFESIKIAKSLGESPDILFTVTNKTYTKLPQMYDIALKYDLILIVNPVFSYFGNPGLSIKALDYIEEFIKGKSKIYMNEGFIKLRRDGGNNIKKPSCKAVSRVIVISPKNEIILPCFHFGKEFIKIDKPIKEIIKQDYYQYYKKNEGRFDFCKGCTVNCYFEPSFAFPFNKYGLRSLKSKFKYGFNKIIRPKIKNFKNIIKNR